MLKVQPRADSSSQTHLMLRWYASRERAAYLLILAHSLLP